MRQRFESFALFLKYIVSNRADFYRGCHGVLLLLVQYDWYFGIITFLIFAYIGFTVPLPSGEISSDGPNGSGRLV